MVLATSLSGFCQEFRYQLQQVDGATNKVILEDYQEKKPNYSNAIEANQALQATMAALYKDGHIAASVDSFYQDSLSLSAYIRTGGRYKWALLERGNVEDYILSRSGFRDKLYYSRPFNIREVNKLFTRVITYCENHGYPFASIRLDSVQFQGEGVQAGLQLNKNTLFLVDSIKLVGDAKISATYIGNYLSIKQGDPYNESLIKRISARIKELAFVEETQPHEVIFSDEKATLILHLKNKKASRFNGIIGLLPDEGTGKILFTGDVELNLQNALGRGEVIDLNWRKLQTNTQDLQLFLTYPFLLNSPLGLDGSLKLYRRDTLFTDLHRQLGLQYLLSGGNYLKVYFNRQTSNIISTVGLEEQITPPPYLDVAINSYGIALKKDRLDYRLNPTRGYQLLVSGSVGNKEIKRNVNLNPVMYDSLELKTVQYQSNIAASIFLPLASRTTIKVGVNGGLLYNENMFRNELFRIGGIKTLRGFDEESITASSYSIFTTELRYLLEQNSYAYLFWDGAYYEDRSQERDGALIDRPFGFGAGVSFETKAGIFSINYALGRQQNNPILLRAAKIHFGFVNYF